MKSLLTYITRYRDVKNGNKTTRLHIGTKWQLIGDHPHCFELIDIRPNEIIYINLERPDQPISCTKNGSLAPFKII